MLLRYETSGAIYIVWLILFYIGLHPYSSSEQIINNLLNDKLPWGGFFIAFPIGVIIHQISVNLKNMVVCKFYKYLNDSPDVAPTSAMLNRLNIIDNNGVSLNKREKTFEYVRNRISSLNSFYYARIDNGVIAPFFAWYSAIFLRFSLDGEDFSTLLQRSIGCDLLLFFSVSLIILAIIQWHKAQKDSKKNTIVMLFVALITIVFIPSFVLFISITTKWACFMLFCAIFIGVMMALYVPNINSEIETYCRRI